MDCIPLGGSRMPLSVSNNQSTHGQKMTEMMETDQQRVWITVTINHATDKKLMTEKDGNGPAC
jgi:hypothetical protein